jgi:hypothetical protein
LVHAVRAELLLLLQISLTTFKSLGWFCMQSPDGDVICCVPPHLQPAFDHPKLRGHRPEVRTTTSFTSLLFLPPFAVASNLL